MKTYSDVIDETVEVYSKLGRRSLNNKYGSCRYNGPGGIQCALARCCTEGSEFREGFSIFSKIGGEDVLVQKDFKLKPEYAHLSDLNFWADIQSLHDDEDNWNFHLSPSVITGLSRKGVDRVKALKKKWE